MVSLYILSHTYIHARTHAHTHTRAHTHTHTHTHAHTRTYIHTYIYKKNSWRADSAQAQFHAEVIVVQKQIALYCAVIHELSYRRT